MNERELGQPHGLMVKEAGSRVANAVQILAPVTWKTCQARVCAQDPPGWRNGEGISPQYDHAPLGAAHSLPLCLASTRTLGQDQEGERRKEKQSPGECWAGCRSPWGQAGQWASGGHPVFSQVPAALWAPVEARCEKGLEFLAPPGGSRVQKEVGAARLGKTLSLIQCSHSTSISAERQ